MNKVILTGRLTKDPELKDAGQYKICRFTLAVSKFKNGEQGADFIECSAWEKVGTTLCTYTRKGSLILVEGELSTSTYQNKEGVQVTKTVVNANKIEFLSPKGEKVEDSQKAKSPYDYYEPEGNPTNPAGDVFTDITNKNLEDDLPF